MTPFYWVCLTIYIAGAIFVVLGDSFYTGLNSRDPDADAITSSLFWPIVLLMIILASPIFLINRLGKHIGSRRRLSQRIGQEFKERQSETDR